MLYTLKEVAKELRYNERTIRRWIKQGKINAKMVGAEWRISEEELKRIKGES